MPITQIHMPLHQRTYGHANVHDVTPMEHSVHLGKKLRFFKPQA